MAICRPAGFSDEDSDSDDYGFYDKPVRKFIPVQQENPRKKIENRLQDAVINGDLDDLKSIIFQDCHNNPNTRLDSGWTPLMHACFHAQDKLVEWLLEDGADPNLHCDSVTPIMVACSNSAADNDSINSIIDVLIKKKCLLNIGDKYGQTPLMRAISSGRAAVVEKLLDAGVNIEMRDRQGWTAVFWAVHNNQREILQLLIDKGARLTEVDRYSRTLNDIAVSDDHEGILEVIHEHTKTDQEEDVNKNVGLINQLHSWHEFYPGVEKGKRPNYSSEIPHLLYGMSLERLAPLFIDSKMDLRTFLLLQEGDMIEIGIEMPYERQRLKNGLKNFHLRGWRLNSVAGLYAMKVDHYSVLDCLTTLGTHLQQLYILEATLTYTLRSYTRVQDRIKFEPPDSPVLNRLQSNAKSILGNLNNIRKEIRNMRILLYKISKTNPPPADLIREKSPYETILSYAYKVVSICSLGILFYSFKDSFLSAVKK